jgi:hypothetical protein
MRLLANADLVEDAHFISLIDATATVDNALRR